jgi:hypothetical protein
MKTTSVSTVLPIVYKSIWHHVLNLKTSYPDLPKWVENGHKIIIIIILYLTILISNSEIIVDKYWKHIIVEH